MTTEQVASPAAMYEEYFVPAIFDPLASVVLDHAPPSAGASVLDVACGTGILVRRVAREVGDASSLVGVDVNPAMLELARSRAAEEGLRIDWREGDATALDLPDRAFDVVTCQQGLQFFPDRAAAAGEMRRVLVDGGHAVLAVWQGRERHPLYAALADAEVPHLTAFGVPVTHDDAVRPFSLGDPDELGSLLSDAGFTDVAVVQDSIEARFPTPDRFMERLEYAYAAVVPKFMDDPSAFASYLEAVGRETREVVARYRDGDHVVVPMHTNVAIARA